MMKYAYTSPTITEIKHVGKIGWEWHDVRLIGCNDTTRWRSDYYNRQILLFIIVSIQAL